VAQFGDRAEQFEENGRYFGENGFFERSPSKTGEASNLCAHGRSVADTSDQNGIGSPQYGPEADDSGYENGGSRPTADGSADCD
jgi:hypothetical protein